MDNKLVYEDKKLLSRYKDDDLYLEPSEKGFILRNKLALKSMKMLDIGIGLGRTTFYFSDLVGEYAGIDYSKTMVDECKTTYPGLNLRVCDVRDMSVFPEGYFDFAMFSYNGLDYIPHEDRINALKEINRVLKKGGVFFFSSHNTEYIETLYSLKYSADPRTMAFYALQWVKLRIKNPDIRKKISDGHVMFFDGGLNFRLNTYYVSPEEQIKQLRTSGFTDIRLYSSITGLEIGDINSMKNERWIHYLCIKNQ
jgi:SAM-dependent methyltransferase